MKFRACFSDVGVAWLEKRFLPAFEKASPGRTLELTLLLTPDSVFLIYDAKQSGGPEIHADFAVRARAGFCAQPRRFALLARPLERFALLAALRARG
jgi:hypothetical protein